MQLSLRHTFNKILRVENIKISIYFFCNFVVVFEIIFFLIKLNPFFFICERFQASASPSSLASASVTNMTPSICANILRCFTRHPSFINKLPDRGVISTRRRQRQTKRFMRFVYYFSIYGRSFSSI